MSCSRAACEQAPAGWLSRKYPRPCGLSARKQKGARKKKKKTMRLIQAAGLRARLLSSPLDCFAGQLARSVDQHPLSWVSSVSPDVTSAAVPHPVEWGIHPGCAGDVAKKWLQHARLILIAALRDLQLDVRPDLGECILAYLDDVTILANPQRALDFVRRFERDLAFHTRLCLNLSKNV